MSSQMQVFIHPNSFLLKLHSILPCSPSRISERIHSFMFFNHLKIPNSGIRDSRLFAIYLCERFLTNLWREFIKYLSYLGIIYKDWKRVSPPLSLSWFLYPSRDGLLSFKAMWCLRGFLWSSCKMVGCNITILYLI